MKSILNSNCCKKVEKPFPKLMRACSSGAILLMTSRSVGTVVNGRTTTGFGVGSHKSNWESYFLEDYEGSVTLCND